MQVDFQSLVLTSAPQQTRRQRRRAHKDHDASSACASISIPKSSHVLVFLESGFIAFCHVSSSTLSELPLNSAVSFDTSVSIEASKAVQWSQCVNKTSFRLESVTPLEQPQGFYHAKLPSLIKLDDNDNEKTESTIPRISVLNKCPVLSLLSVSLTLESVDPAALSIRVSSPSSSKQHQQSRDDAVHNIESQPLLLSCLKSQLVGTFLLWRDDPGQHIDSVVRVRTMETVYRFRTESLWVSPQQQQSSRNKVSTSTIFYRIFPSTKITITTASTATLASAAAPATSTNQNPNAPMPQQQQQATVTPSPVAQYLIDTQRCLQQQASSSSSSASVSSAMPYLDDGMLRFILLAGPPGTGKTHALRTAVETLGIPLLSLQGSQIMATTASHVGEAIRDLTESVRRACRNNRPTMIFLDEVDALVASPNESMATALASLMDEIARNSNNSNNHKKLWYPKNHKNDSRCLVMLVAATNRVDVIPAHLRRRFDHEIAMTPPRVEERLEILSNLLLHQAQAAVTDMPTRKELLELARDCVGCVPSDLAAIVRKACVMAYTQQEDPDNTNSSISLLDRLRHAATIVGASALRDAAMQAPPRTVWNDIAGDAGGAKKALQQAIEWPRTRKAAFDALGLTPPRGILLYGPPGCAKTTLARAAAGAAGVAFLKLDPADVYASSFVGDAEAVVRRAFALARAASPCIIFFDEIDAIVGSSSMENGMTRGSSAEARVLSTFLNEMDGVDRSPADDGVIVLGATNRPWTLDAALLRPGRLDKIIHVPPPDDEARRQLLSKQTEGWPLTNSDGGGSVQLDMDRLVKLSERMTGAEIVGACRDAARKALRISAPNRDGDFYIDKIYLEEAMLQVKPLLQDDAVLEEYKKFEKGHRRL